MRSFTPRVVLTLSLCSAPFIGTALAQTPVAVPTLAPATPTVDWRTATDIPGVDMSGLSAAQKTTALDMMRTQSCGCPCGMKLAECRINDRNCPVSPGLAAKLVQLVKDGKSADEIKTALAVPAQPAAPAAPPPLGEKVEIATAGSPFKGAAKGKITIVEFSDFECPFCNRVLPWLDEVVKAYPNDVKLVFKQFPLPMHKNAKLAAEAALAANDQGKFWPMHDKLFENFRGINRESIGGWAKEMGLDMAKFDAALNGGTFTKAVEKDMADAQKAGVNGTPTIFINGKRYQGGRDLASTKAVIDEELKAAAAPVAAPATKK